MKIRGLAFALVITGVAGLGSAAMAKDRGLNPGYAFSVWANINSGLVAASFSTVRDAALLERMKSLKPETFSGKGSEDVLAQIRAFRSKLDALRQRAGLAPSHREPAFNAWIDSGDIFRSSGYVLDGLVEWVMKSTDPAFRVSPLYRHEQYPGKRSNDVYALVDLANRRIDLILASDNG